MDRRKFIITAGLVLPVAGVIPASALNLINATSAKLKEEDCHATGLSEKADYTIRMAIFDYIKKFPLLLE